MQLNSVYEKVRESNCCNGNGSNNA
jgi:hypothetical protein